MELVPEALVEETWQEVAGFDEDRGHLEMRQLCERQPNLVAFIMTFSEDLDQDLRELAAYMLFNVCRMFEKNTKKKNREISAEEIMNCYKSNEELVASLEGAHEKFFDRIARVQLSEQPYVMKYVVDTLIESPEDEDLPDMTDDDIGCLFLLLKTVIDVFHHATQALNAYDNSL